jgi:hypothetical protein
MIVLVLVVVWVLALTPYALRKLGEWQVSSEVNRFHRGLGALGQFFSGPAQPSDARFVPVGGYPGEPGVDGGGWQPSRPASPGEPLRRLDGEPGEARPGPRAPRSYRPSHQLVMRRRRVLAWLGTSLAGSFAFGAIPWFRPLWDLSLVVLVIGVSYVGALVYVQRQAVLAAERTAKVVRLRAVRSPTRLHSGGPERPAAVVGALSQVAASGGGGFGQPHPGERPVVASLPRRPSFVLVDAPS